jgi:hypothetical protein
MTDAAHHRAPGGDLGSGPIASLGECGMSWCPGLRRYVTGSPIPEAAMRPASVRPLTGSGHGRRLHYCQFRPHPRRDCLHRARLRPDVARVVGIAQLRGDLFIGQAGSLKLDGRGMPEGRKDAVAGPHRPGRPLGQTSSVATSSREPAATHPAHPSGHRLPREHPWSSRSQAKAARPPFVKSGQPALGWGSL